MFWILLCKFKQAFASYIYIFVWFAQSRRNINMNNAYDTQRFRLGDIFTFALEL